MSHQEYFLKEYERFINSFDENFGLNVDVMIYDEFKPLILQMCEIWNKQEHSGFSANFFAKRILKMVESALLFKPILPFNSEEDFDFMEMGDNQYQSRRYFSVFKKNDKIYDIDSIVFYDVVEDTAFTTNMLNLVINNNVYKVNTHNKIKFPYYPNIYYLYVSEIDEDKYVLAQGHEYRLIEIMNNFDDVLIDENGNYVKIKSLKFELGG